jgi:hypothetical protein
MNKVINKDAYKNHQGETISQVYNCESGLGDELSRGLSSKGCAMCNKDDNLKYCEKCKCSMVINPKTFFFNTNSIVLVNVKLKIGNSIKKTAKELQANTIFSKSQILFTIYIFTCLV